jgi:cold shock CspA family protein
VAAERALLAALPARRPEHYDASGRILYGGCMAAGRVLKYDQTRGYGFVAPDSGGDDVFIHVNDFEFDKSLMTAGARLEFSIEESGRGLKASNIQFIEPGPAPSSVEPRPASDVRSVDDGLCDVLTTKEFTEEITEALLNAAPTMSGGNILTVRQHLVRLAHSHGWIDS